MRKLHGRMDFNGLQISIENRRGSVREWYDPHADRHGMTRMKYPYGYVRMSEGVDGDHFDCFIGPHRDAPMVYVVTQMKAPEFTEVDEQKAMLGFLTAADAKATYLEHYSDSRFFGSMQAMPFADFRNKVLATKENPVLIKSHVVSHLRHLKTGAVAVVRDYYDRKRKAAKDRKIDDLFAHHATAWAKGDHDRMAFYETVIDHLTLQKSMSDDAKSAGFTRYCRKVGDSLKVDWDRIDFDQFCAGMKSEMEHRDVTGGDPVKTAKIALAHLKEVSDYYTKLEKIEKSVQTFIGELA